MEIINIKLKLEELRSLLYALTFAMRSNGLGDYPTASFLNEKTIQKLIIAEDFEIVFSKKQTDVYSVIHMLDGRQFSISETGLAPIALLISHLCGSDALSGYNTFLKSKEIIRLMQSDKNIHIIFTNLSELWSMKVLVY